MSERGFRTRGRDFPRSSNTSRAAKTSRRKEMHAREEAAAGVAKRDGETATEKDREGWREKREGRRLEVEVARDSAGCLCLSMEIGKGGQRMQITGSRGLPEPGGSRGSTDRKAVYKVVFLSLRLTSSPSLSPSLFLSLSHPLSGHARPLSLPQTMHEALAPATVTASYISRGSGGGGTRVTSTDIKVVLACDGVWLAYAPWKYSIFTIRDASVVQPAQPAHTRAERAENAG